MVAKKWHVAKRLTDRLRALTDIPAVDYLFNEHDANLPDTGGIANTLAKRERHRKALIKLLFDQFESDRLVLCADPSALSLITDLVNYRAEVRVLFLDCAFDDDYVRGHMSRVGLVSETAPDEVFNRLLSIVKSDLEHEAERLRESEFPHFASVSAGASVDQNTAAIARILDLPEARARELAETPHLFAD